jgi:hypothetical protein
MVAVMDVYLVPVGPERYELYCESADDAPATHDPAPNGLFRRLQDRFSQTLAALEREHERERARARSQRHRRDGLLRRLRGRGVRWLAERVAEQRLLWRLRGQARVRAMYPAQLDDARALGVIRRNLQADADRHSRWLVVDVVGLLFSGLLAPFPGPNLPGYYFTFRVVGHLLAIRGAKQGLRKVEWVLHASQPLGRLGDIVGLPAEERLERLRAIEAELGLVRLARFLERIALKTA